MGRKNRRADQSPKCTKLYGQRTLGDQWDSTKGRLEAVLDDLNGKDASDLLEELRGLEKLLYNIPDKH